MDEHVERLQWLEYCNTQLESSQKDVAAALALPDEERVRLMYWWLLQYSLTASDSG